jgi:hypothetical protein
MKKRHTPEVGNLYPAKGGHGRGTPDMWVVVAIVTNPEHPEETDLLGKKVVLLGLKHDHSIVSAATYTALSMSEREVLGKVDIKHMRFEP